VPLLESNPMASSSTSSKEPPPPDGAADALRTALESLDAALLGAELQGLVRELYPLNRSITGDGVRASLRMLQRLAPLELHEVASGTQVFDWVVPREWNFRSARLVGPKGELVADASQLNLHLLNYSIAFHGSVPLEELEKHLHSLPEAPSWVPYRTSYYREAWGFCLSHAQRSRLAPGNYQVDIDTTLADGSLTYGELLIPGEEEAEVLVSTHCCHPSLANDNCAGMAMCAALARLLSTTRPRYSYRFLFVPGTIGAITWLALHEAQARRIAHGLVAACVGDKGRLTYKRSRRGDTELDRAVVQVLLHSGQEYEVRDFTPYGYDERQYGSPGFNLAVGSLTRTPYGEYPEYHTSADEPSLVVPEKVVDTFRRYLEVFEVLEGNRLYKNLAPHGEPQLGKRGLYGAVGGQSHAQASQMALLWVLNLGDGTRTLLDIAERAKLPFPEVRRAARALEAAGLLARVGG
jgi:aminopeptidase-like protein